MIGFVLMDAIYKCVESTRAEIAVRDNIRYITVITTNLADMTECVVADGTQMFLDVLQDENTRIIE